MPSMVRFCTITTPTSTMARKATSRRGLRMFQNSEVGLRTSSRSEPCGHDFTQLPHMLQSRFESMVRGTSYSGQAAARGEPLAHQRSLQPTFLQLSWLARKASGEVIE